MFAFFLYIFVEINRMMETVCFVSEITRYVNEESVITENVTEESVVQTEKYFFSRVVVECPDEEPTPPPEPPVVEPVLDFSDPNNSQFIPILFGKS